MSLNWEGRGQLALSSLIAPRRRLYFLFWWFECEKSSYRRTSRRRPFISMLFTEQNVSGSRYVPCSFTDYLDKVEADLSTKGYDYSVSIKFLHIWLAFILLSGWKINLWLAHGNGTQITMTNQHHWLFVLLETYYAPEHYRHISPLGSCKSYMSCSTPSLSPLPW